MKLYRNALILLVVLGLLIGAVLVIKNRKAPEAASDSTSDVIKITDIKTDELVRITIDNKGDRFVMEQKDNKWSLKEPADIKADEGSLSGIATNAETLSTSKVVDEDAKDLSAYGLDKPVVVTLTLKNGTEQVVEIGSQVATKTGYYVKTKASNKVYKIDSYYAEKLLVTKNAIRSKVLYTLDKGKIDSISMDRNGQQVFSSKKSGDLQWEILNPIQGNANDSAITPMIDAVSALQVTEFIEDNCSDLGKYGLANPAYAVEFGTSAEKHKIYLGDEKTKGSQIYAKLDNSNDVFTVAEDGLTFLDKPLKEIIEVFAYIVNIQDVNSIKVEIDGRVDNIEIQTNKDDSEKDKFTLNGRDATVKDESDKQYFRQYYQSLIGVTLSDIEVGAKPTGTPEITITYNLKKSPGTMKVEFIPKDDKNYYVVRNGVYAGFYVEKDKFNGPEGLRETYKKLIELMDKQKK